MNLELKDISKLKGFPWRGMLGVLGASFLLANVSSIYISSLFDPVKLSKVAKKNERSGSPAIVQVPFNKSDVDKIIDQNIFRAEVDKEELQQEEKVEQNKELSAVKSNLPLKLIGTIYGTDPNAGVAIIENTSKKSINSFVVGDSLGSNATLIEVLHEKVILLHDENREYLELEKIEIVRSQRKKSRSSGKPVKNKLRPLATEPPPDEYKEEGLERKGNETKITRTKKQSLLTTGMAKVLQDAKAEPNVANGEMLGFKLTRIRQDSIYEKLGLQNNDIIEEINGTPLTGAGQAIKLLNSLRTTNEVELTVNRGGSRTSYFVEFQ